MPVTTDDDIELLQLLEFEQLLKVSPKLEKFRDPFRLKIAYGGRGAGAKTWSIASLLVQFAQAKCIRVLCTREIQLSMPESVHRIIKQQIMRLGYKGWHIDALKAHP